MDILQPMPIEKWPSLLEITKENWPTNAYYYNWIITAIKWKKKKPTMKINVFCPNGDLNSKIFVGIFSEGMHAVTIFSSTQSKELFKKVVSETKVIDWNQKILGIGGIQTDLWDVLFTALKENDRKYHARFSINYFKPKEECVNVEFKVPDECRLGYLDTSHVELVHSLWPHRIDEYPELSINLLKTYITANKAVGLFLKKDNTLVSWIFETEYGGLGLLQTLDEHKRKGYGKVVTQAMMKELAKEEDLDCVLFILKQNATSRKLFESLGFMQLADLTWITVES